MEPPTKRPRFGPGSLVDDDPEADELNERPEDVNARRDPAVQLERSRAFAAFKLKSAFERIFEKYEKDFTGVGDEIDLKTGEIVVDNGHIHSLRDAQLGGADDDDDEEDVEEDEDGNGRGSGNEAPEAGPLNADERMLTGRPESELSRLGQHAPLSIPPQVGMSPFFGGSWPGPVPPMGGSTMLPALMYPGQMPFGGLLAQYGSPISLATTDPTWRTPELPTPLVRDGLPPKALVRKKKARLSLGSAREQQVGDDDDILSGASTFKKDGGKDEAIVTKQKLLSPRPASEATPDKRKRGRPKGSGLKKGQAKLSGEKKVVESSNEKLALESGSPAGPRGTQVLKATRRSRKSSAVEAIPGARETPQRGAGVPDLAVRVSATHSEAFIESAPIPTLELNGAVPSELTGDGSKGDEELDNSAPTEPQPAERQEAEPDPEEADVYMDMSTEEGRLAKKPRNQTLRVELPGNKPLDFGSFRALTPEHSVADSSGAQEPAVDGLDGFLAVDQVSGRNPPVRNGDATPRTQNQIQKAQSETFSRNTVDAAYAFSDEDDVTVPRKIAPRQKPRRAAKTTNSDMVLREICQNIDSGAARLEYDSVEDKPFQVTDKAGPARAPSPTLSLDLDAALPHDVRGFVEPLALEREGTGSYAVASDFKKRTDEQRIDVASTGEGSAKQEIPSTSPALPWTNRLRPTAGLPSPASDIENPDSPLPSAEQGPELLEARVRAPSPTLTDPGSKSQNTPTTAPSLSNQVHSPPLLHTPTKTPYQRKPNARRRPSSTTPAVLSANTTTTTTTKKRGVLSLLPGPDDDEDELSILSPIQPIASGPNTVRSTPAGHHVRLGLLETTSGSSSKAAVKLRRVVSRSSVAGRQAAGDGFRTPTGRKGRAAVREMEKRRMSALDGVAFCGMGKGFVTPSSRVVDSELVQTPGGTMRRCGDGGFRCERDFCFSCM